MNLLDRLRDKLGINSLFGQNSSLNNVEQILNLINSHKKRFEKLPDSRLQELTSAFTKQVQAGEPIESIIAPYFALVREASKRVLSLFPYDEQIIASIILTKGAIAEIATGEGKTLITTLPAAIHALKKKGVHIVTVNAYLTERDCEETSPLYKFLGFSVSLVKEDDTPEQKIQAYQQDITFGTGYQFGFDYLREQLRLINQTTEPQGYLYRQKLLGKYTEPIQQATHKVADFVIIDEVDSVLLDEGNMPLVIAGPSSGPHPYPYLFLQAKSLATSLLPQKDFTFDIPSQSIKLTDEGKNRVYAQASKFNLKGLRRPFHLYVEAALKAHIIFKKDTHYVVQANKIAIVDENTGRRFEERTWKDGLHQAVQAKENIQITEESESLASISRQKYFNFYPNRAGMTGTGAESESEFKECFKLEFKKVPLHKPSQLLILPPKIFPSKKDSLDNLIEEITTIHAQGRPILIGTRTIKESEEIAQRLKRLYLQFALLNAKQDEEEAHIVAKAGHKGAITIATNMAGRGTHITVDKETQALGGLHVIPVEHQESPRVDRQLIGRTARQGQPGSAQFFLSAEDYIIQRYDPKNAQKFKSLPINNQGLLDPKLASIFQKIQVKIERDHYYQRKYLIAHDNWIDTVKRKL